MSDDTVTIEVDGKSLPARKGQMLIEVTDGNDIYVPRFCYHKKLSVAANCRMCLVEVEKAPKPLPACATPVMDGMKVYTRSKKALEAQKGVMEFLLINHPLDCPICDQGGECELQDLAMGYGRDVSRYNEKKRVVKDKNIGPLIQTDMTRCIHCTRCVRFGEEIAGLRELGATGRGEHMEIGTYIEKSMVSEMSGNVIDICPVGALTSKPFRYSARTWEMRQYEGIAPHDSVGTNIQLHLKRNRVKRVVPAENEAINEVWMSDRDRFSYEGLYSVDRLTEPMIKQNGNWQEVDWETALDFVRDGLQDVITSNGTKQLGALASASATLEELYLLQKFMRGVGSHNIDHRLRQSDFSDQAYAPAFPWLGQSISALERLDAVLLIGSNVRKEQPIINHRLRKATMRGCRMMVVNPYDFDNTCNITDSIITDYRQIPNELGAVLKALAEQGAQGPDGVMESLHDVTVREVHRNIAANLLAAEQGTVLLGNLATAHPALATIRTLAHAISQASGTSLGYIAESANTAGAWLAGVLPHRQVAAEPDSHAGLDARAMLEEPLAAYITLGIEPELDCWNGNRALRALKCAGFVVALTANKTDAMQDYTNALLPIGQFVETSGTYINNEGRAQSFQGVVKPPGEARPAWKVLRVLGNLFDLAGFDYNSSTDVRDECQAYLNEIAPDNALVTESPVTLPGGNGGLHRIASIPMNSIDPLTRRSQPLQETADVADGAVHVNRENARQLGVDDGDRLRAEQDEHSTVLPVVIDARVPDRSVLIHATQSCHAELGDWYGKIKLSKA